MTTLGKITDGTGSSASSSNKAAVSSFTASASGTVTAGHARAWLSASGTCTTRVVIYADSSGAPGALLAQSDVITLTITAEAQTDYVFSGANQIAITNGTAYWVGLSWQTPSAGSLNLSRDSTASSRQESNNYLPNPFGSPTAQSGPVDVFVDFTSTTSVPVSDSAALSEAASTVMQARSTTDSGALTEGTSAVTQGRSTTDSAALSESSALADLFVLSGSTDTGTLSESSSLLDLVVKTGTTETSTLTEGTSTLLQARSTTDSGTLSESSAGALSTSTTDSAALSESTGTLSRATSTTDSGALSSSSAVTKYDTFGKLTDGAASSASSADKTAVSQFTAAADGNLAAGHARVWVTGGSGNTKVVVYADSSGAPGAKLAESDVLAITNTTEAVRDYVFSGVNQATVITGTTYWLGLAWQDPGTDSVTLSRDATASARQESNSYAPSPFGTPSAQSGPVDVYVDTLLAAPVSKTATDSGALTEARTLGAYVGDGVFYPDDDAFYGDGVFFGGETANEVGSLTEVSSILDLGFPTSVDSGTLAELSEVTNIIVVTTTDSGALTEGTSTVAPGIEVGPGVDSAALTEDPAQITQVDVIAPSDSGALTEGASQVTVFLAQADNGTLAESLFLDRPPESGEVFTLDELAEVTVFDGRLLYFGPDQYFGEDEYFGGGTATLPPGIADNGSVDPDRDKGFTASRSSDEPPADYAVLVAITTTGEIIDELAWSNWSYTDTVDWARPGSMTVTVPLLGKDRLGELNRQSLKNVNSAGPTVSLVLTRKGRALWAGPVASVSWNDATVDIQCMSITKLMDSRVVVNPAYLLNPGDAAGNISYNLSPRDLVIKLLQLGTTGERRGLPLQLPALSGTTTTVLVETPGTTTTTTTPLPADSIYRTIFEEISYELTSTAENSTKDWATAAYPYIQDIGDGRGYTGGIVGFTSADGDMLDVVNALTAMEPTNALASYIPALITLKNEGESSSAGARANTLLGTTFKTKWATAAASDAFFRKAQRQIRDAQYWMPALTQALSDNVQGLGLAILYDISVNHGPGTDPQSFGGIVATAASHAAPPSQGGSETAYLNALINARQAVLAATGDDQPDGRVPMHRALLATGNLTLAAPFSWTVYGDPFTIAVRPDLPVDSARPNGLEPGAPPPDSTTTTTGTTITSVTTTTAAATGQVVQYAASDLGTVSERIKEAVEQEGGPDVVIHPLLNLDQSVMVWEVLVAEFIGSQESTATWDYPVSIKALTGDTDSSQMVTTGYVLGDTQTSVGSIRGFGVSSIDRGVLPPALERADRTSVSNKRQDELDALAVSYVLANSLPAETWSISVHSEADPIIGEDWNLGDHVTVSVTDHPWLDDGEYLRRITGITHDPDTIALETTEVR